MQIKPKRGQVLIVPKEKITVTPGGIYIPETVGKARSNQGVVRAIGDDVKTVKVGDYVLFGKYDYKTVVLEDQRYLIAEEDNLLAVYEK